MICMPNPEYLSKDILEEDFLKVFSYFNVAQRILGSSRVYARDRFVSPPTVSQKLFTVICGIFFSIVCYTFSKLYILRYRDCPFVGLLLQAGVTLYILVFLCNMIHVRFLNNEANVKFYIKMQEIDRTTGIGLHKVMNKFLRFTYNTTILSLGGVMCILLLMFVNLGLLLLGFISTMYLYFTVTLETVYCINLSAYFVSRLRFINSIIANYIDLEHFVGKVTLYNVTKRSSIRQLAAQTHDFRTCDVDIHLKALFQCFEQFQNLYRFQRTSCTNCPPPCPSSPFDHVDVTRLLKDITSLKSSLAELQCRLDASDSVSCVPKLPMLSPAQMVASAIALAGARNALRPAARASVPAETSPVCMSAPARVYSAVAASTSRLATSKLERPPSAKRPIRHKAKMTLKMIEESTPSFKVYDIMEINAESMLKLTSFVTFLVVTLLQFAFL
ncbi:uncharacterized protein LOC113235375 [Hyposmocoma kahamanoa]|uniref:uncharacterized protein LOC113235375 n=1 Tax=Hyposmocoma kahamanoa TaxID=1477025 RepID=UPI000E6D9D0E|nr:uncharacterized protein LOC113235375 [Hyposmocoma kahamanoa]